MTNELLNEWKKEKIVEDGDIVLAGVSGGADSVCLLLMLEQLQKKTDFLLEAVHVEHGIRGEESRKDAAFVKTLCQDHGIRCHIFSVEVPLFAEKHGLGLEEAALQLQKREIVPGNLCTVFFQPCDSLHTAVFCILVKQKIGAFL